MFENVSNPRSGREWAVLRSVGNVPSPRSGHAAVVVGVHMYIFGGRDVVGNYLGDLSAFDIVGRRWYTFRDEKCAPSPRSGLCMSSYGHRIYVVGGETSTQDEEEIGMIYTLDTSKLKFDTIGGMGAKIDHLPPKQ